MKRSVISPVLALLAAAVVTLFFRPLLARDRAEQKDNLLIANHIHDQLKESLSRPIVVSRSMAADRLLISALKSEQKQSQEAMEALMADYLEGIKDSFDYIATFVISEKTHRYYTPSGISKVIDPKNDPYDIWYPLFLSSGKKVSLDTDRDQVNGYRWTVFLNSLITDEHDNLLGVCGVGLFMDDLQELFAHEEKKYGLKINFIGKDGLVQVDTDTGNIENAYISDALADNAGSDAFTYMPRRSGGWRMTRYMPELDWFLVVQHPEREKTVPVLPALLAVYALLALLAVLGLCQQKQETAHDLVATDQPKDVLTGLPNRNYVRDSFGEQGIFNTARYKTLAMFDIDRFKVINESRDGDAIILKVVELAAETVGDEGMLFRWAGDEFVCFLEMDSVAAEAAFAKFCAATEKELDVTVSVGIVEVDLTESIKTNYHRAVQQCYAVKERGGNGVQVLS